MVSDLSQIRILLVDDDVMCLKLIEHHLRDNFEDKVFITATQNPGEAIAMNVNDEFDICISDLDMPAYNGFNLLKTIKATDSLIEVIILTGYPSSNAIRSAFAMGASDYLVKPIDTAILVKSVAFYMDRVRRIRNEISDGCFRRSKT